MNATTITQTPPTGKRSLLERLGDRSGFFRLTVVQRFIRQRLAMSGLVFIIGVVVLCALAPVISPYPFDKGELTSALQGPSSAHWLGTDDVGRDILSRMLYGGRTTLLAALQATTLSVAIGVPTGLVAALFGGWVDMVLSRIADAVMTFPALFLAVVIVGISGPGLTNAMIAIGIVYAPRLFRVARAAGVGILTQTYILSARTVGCGRGRILGRHMLPNALSPILVQVSLTMATAILAEGSLSFLGLGVQPPQASWGALLARGVPQISTHPTPVIAAGLAISFVVLAFNLIGDGARDSIGRERVE